MKIYHISKVLKSANTHSEEQAINFNEEVHVSISFLRWLYVLHTEMKSIEQIYRQPVFYCKLTLANVA